MTWFYHAPGEGRIGPLSADEIRTRYRDRRIQRDTLVWREGLREWQPLERVADEVDLFSVTPDSSRPPPLPAAMPAPMTPVMSAPGGYAYAGAPIARPEPKRMHGCLIALIVAAVISVPMIGILAAIAMPAYNDYLVRSKVAAYVMPRTSALRLGTERALATLGRCPGDALEAGLEGDAAAGTRVGELDDGRCAFEITVTGVDASVDGKTLLYTVPPAAGGAWDCTGGDLPAKYRAAECRATDESGATR